MSGLLSPADLSEGTHGLTADALSSTAIYLGYAGPSAATGRPAAARNPYVRPKAPRSNQGEIPKHGRHWSFIPLCRFQ